MAAEPRWDDKAWPFGTVEELSAEFTGELHDVTDARLAAEDFLRRLARASPPTSPEHWNDVLLVVDELAASASSTPWAPSRCGCGPRSTGSM